MNSKILLFLICAGSLVFAQGAPYLIVFDASGSMDETLSGTSQTKMEAAKTAANNFIDGSSAEIGLVVFEDCDSGGDVYSGGIQLRQDFTTSKALLKGEIDSLSPQSSTPIARALEESAYYLESTRGSGTIILITDGEETCGGDPVATAEQIRNSGIGVVNVVGYTLDPSSAAAQQAQEIAQAGGGRYYSAQNADELQGALTDITGGGSCCPSTLLLLALPLLGFIANRRLN